MGGMDGKGETYRQTTLRMMMRTVVVKMFAMPRAKQRIMVRMPSLLRDG
jgi:hypothetical protein